MLDGFTTFFGYGARVPTLLGSEVAGDTRVSGGDGGDLPRCGGARDDVDAVAGGECVAWRDNGNSTTKGPDNDRIIRARGPRVAIPTVRGRAVTAVGVVAGERNPAPRTAEMLT